MRIEDIEKIRFFYRFLDGFSYKGTDYTPDMKVLFMQSEAVASL